MHCTVFNSREMWDLINVDDRERLTVDQLETGIATVTRSDDFFDCHPAIQAAFKFTKLVTNRGVTKTEDNLKEEGEKKIVKTIVFDEFRTFLAILRQYYIYCQVNFSSIKFSSCSILDVWKP